MSQHRTHRQWVLDDLIPAVTSKIDKEIMAGIFKRPMDFPTTHVIYGVQIQCTTLQALRIMRRCTGTPAHLNTVQMETMLRNKTSVPAATAWKFAVTNSEFISMVLGHIMDVLAEDSAAKQPADGDGDES